MAISGKNVLKYFVINVVTATTPELVAAVPGKHICVVNYTLVIKGATVVTFKSAANPISGPLDPGAAAVVDASGVPESPCFQTALGEALNLTNSAAVQVSGHGTYIEVD